MESQQSISRQRPTYELTRFQTKAIDSWGAMVSRKIITLRPDPHRPISYFNGQVAVARFHNSIVADVHASSHRVIRNNELISDDERRYCKIVWQAGGCTLIEQKRYQATIRPKEWAIYDTSWPYAFEVSDHARFIVLLLPLDEFGEYVDNLDRVAGKALAAVGTAEVARAALASLLAGDIEIEAEGQRLLQDSILALIGNATRAVDGFGKGAQRKAEQKLRIVRAYIDENLIEPDLTPDNVAAACGISRRSLYDAFNTLGQTPYAYIQRQRLARAREILSRPGHQDVSITKLAYELGFSDAAHFSRSFKMKYGTSPSNWRNKQVADC